jgi:hypothetical protein
VVSDRVRTKKGAIMNKPLELEDITGLTLTVVGVLIEKYVQRGYADPTMYRALQASTELAEHFKARLEYDGTHGEELLNGVSELITSLKLTAIECGEVVERIIEDNGWQAEAENWSDPNHNCETDHADGEE